MSTRVTVHQVHHDGAEDVVVAPRGRHEGSVYTGTVDGAVLRVRPDGSVEQVGSTGGRPLGLEIDPARVVEQNIVTGPWGIRLDKGNDTPVAY